MADILLDKIEDVRSKRRRVSLLAGIGRTVVVLILLLILIFALDWMLNTPRTARVILMLAALVVLGITIKRTIIRVLKEYIDDDTIALLVEKNHPELQGRLIATIQLQRKDPAMLGGISMELIEALEDETRSHTAGFRFSEIITAKNMLRALLVAFAFIAIALGYTLMFADTAGVLFQRLALSDEKYPTRTRIVSLTGNLKVDKGEPAELRLEVEGAIPDEADFRVKSADGEWSKNMVFRAGRDSKAFLFTISRVMGPLKYYAIAGDVKSEVYVIEIQDRPQVQTIKTVIQFPDYTGKGTVENRPGMGEIRAVGGSRATVAINATRPLKMARLLFVDGGVKQMQIGPDGTTATVDFIITSSDSYSVRLKDLDEVPNRNPAHYAVVMLKDMPPRVTITHPTLSKRVTAFSQWKVTYSVRDDFGLSRTYLVYDINEGRRKGKLQAPVQHVSGQLYGGEAKFDLSKLSLKPGDTLKFWVRAADNRAQIPNIGKSEPLEFTIVTPEEKRMEILERWQNALDKVQNIIQEQGQTKKDTDQIKKQ